MTLHETPAEVAARIMGYDATDNDGRLPSEPEQIEALMARAIDADRAQLAADLMHPALVAEVAALLEASKIQRTPTEIDNAIQATVEMEATARGRFIEAGSLHSDPETWHDLLHSGGGIFDRLEVDSEDALYDRDQPTREDLAKASAASHQKFIAYDYHAGVLAHSVRYAVEVEKLTLPAHVQARLEAFTAAHDAYLAAEQGVLIMDQTIRDREALAAREAALQIEGD